MKPAPFSYHAPETLDELLDLASTHPDAEFLAGNQSLGIDMATRTQTPATIIDLNRVDDLRYIRDGDGTTEIGAMTRHRTVERSDRLRHRSPLVAEAAGQIAGPSVRNRGTIGGSIVEGAPAANLPVALLALDAQVTMTSQVGERTVDLATLIEDEQRTNLQPTEVVTAVAIPTTDDSMDHMGMAFLSCKRAALSWPIINAAAMVHLSDPTADPPVIDRAAIALGNATDVPIRITDAEAVVVGNSVTETTLERIETAAIDVADPPDQLHADRRYKRHLAGVYARRAVVTAVDRAISSA